MPHLNISYNTSQITHNQLNAMLSLIILYILAMIVSNPFNMFGPWATFSFLIIKEIYLCYTFYHQYMIGNAFWNKAHPWAIDFNGIFSCVLYALMVVTRVVLAGMGAAYFNFSLLNWLTGLALEDMAFIMLYWTDFGYKWISHLFKLNPNQMDWAYGAFTIFYWTFVRNPIW